jgi:hypothetical protein
VVVITPAALKVLHSVTSWLRHRSPAYWRSEKTMFCIARRVKPFFSPMPDTRSWVMIRPIRVRKLRAVFSLPMIRAYPTSG